MFPDPGNDWMPKFKRFLLDIDSRIDFAVFLSGKWTREIYERFTAFMDRWHVAGWRRWLLVEPLSEMATLGTGGLFVMLALGIPSMRQTSDEDWLKKSDLAVTFLDRYGNEVGNRGIKHNDSVPLDEMPDNLIKATLATEDRRFYEHFGIDFYGTFRALMTNAQAGGVVQGGSTITQQLAKNLFLSNERTIERKINEAFLALWLEAHLSKNEILKLYLDRAYLGGGILFRQIGARCDAAGSRDARRPVQGTDQILSPRQPSRCPRPRQRRARQHGRQRLHDPRPGLRRPAQSGDADRPPRHRRAELLSRLRLRRDAQARRYVSEIRPRSFLRGAHRARLQSPALCRPRGRDRVAPIRPRLWRQPGRGGDRRSRRRRARHGRRPRLRRQPVQPRHRRAAPARVLVQAVCLRHRLGQRLQADFGAGRFAGLHRQLVPTQLFRRLFRIGDADGSDHAFDQRHSGETVDRARTRQSKTRPRHDRADRAQFRHPVAAAGHAVAADRRRRGLRLSTRRRLRDLSQSRQSCGAARGARSAHRHRRSGVALRP